MAKVELTVKQIMNLGLWERVCDYKGWDYYIYNEGMIDENEVVEFDDEFKKWKNKWENPHHWLNEKAMDWDKNKLYAALVHLTHTVDPEEIQSLFQNEMDNDGYFD